jgi:hypothetical protein
MSVPVGEGYVVTHFKPVAQMVKAYAANSRNDVGSEELVKQGKGYTFYRVEETCPDVINKAVASAQNAFIQIKSLTKFKNDFIDENLDLNSKSNNNYNSMRTLKDTRNQNNSINNL